MEISKFFRIGVGKGLGVGEWNYFIVEDIAPPNPKIALFYLFGYWNIVENIIKWVAIHRHSESFF
ncbi:MAG TPA: hypothetical protein EYO61_02935, partial [Campylobacterales bacterium]|nr:hypothetical protein [Campylobacterales bacterium]